MAELPYGETVSAIAGWFFSVGVAGAIAAGLIRFLGEGWISSIFKKRLAEHQHEHELKMESLKHDLERRMDRTIQLREIEFKVVPEMWQLAVKAVGFTSDSVGYFQQYAEVARMTDEELRAFLAQSDLSEHEKSELAQSQDKRKYYNNLIDWKRLDSAHRAITELNNFRILNSIFLPDSLVRQFRELIDLMNKAIVEQRVYLEGGSRPRENGFVDQFIATRDEITNSLEDVIRSRVVISDGAAAMNREDAQVEQAG